MKTAYKSIVVVSLMIQVAFLMCGVVEAANEKPDLVLMNMVAPSEVSTQKVFSVSWTVQNQGDADYRGWLTDCLYLSKDTQLTGESLDCYYYTGPDICFGVVVILFGTIVGDVLIETPLSPGASYTRTLDLVIPNVPPGQYYIIIKTNNANYHYESNYENNVFCLPIIIKVPDLVVTNIFAPISAGTQNKMEEVSWSVQNQGNAEVGAGMSWADALYLSIDGQSYNSTRNLTEVYCYKGEALPPGGSYQAKEQTPYERQGLTPMIYRIPPGTYYLIVVANWVKYVYEDNYENNVLSVPIEIVAPDLVVDNIDAKDQASTQEQIKVSWRVINKGYGKAIGYRTVYDEDYHDYWGWEDKLYLSTDLQLDNSDIFLTDYYHESLDPNESYTVTKTITVPEVPSGTYYIIVKTDMVDMDIEVYELPYYVQTEGWIYETNEENNILAKPVKIGLSPIASFTYSPENPMVGGDIIFDASESYDPDGTIVSYEWDFGDGQYGQGQVISHSYSSNGEYSVILTVTDNDELTNSTSQTVQITAPVISFLDKADLSRQVIGATADGASKVVIQITGLPEDITSDDIQISIPGGAIDGSLENDKKISNAVFTQTYVVPSRFKRDGHPEDLTAKERAIELIITVKGEQIDHEPFTLIRPPVVMVHGLWGNGGDFAGLARQLEENGWLSYFLSCADYDNKASFYQNRDEVSKYVDQILTKAHNWGYACTKVDIVAHSMGGLLVKLTDVWNRGYLHKNVRKIITIGSPYEGSPVADEIFKIRDKKRWVYDFMESFLNFRATDRRDSLSGGAVWNLRTNSAGNSYMPVNTQISGVDCRGIVVGLRDDSGFFDGLELYLTALKMYKNLYDDELHNYLFGTDSSDWVVSATSQRGGATSLPPISVSWHSVEPRDEDFIRLVIETLNQPAQMGQTGGSLISNESSIGTSREQKASSPDEKIYFNKITTWESNEPNGTIEITSPNEGQICTAGGHITISVQGTGDTAHAGVFAFFGSSSWADIVQLPWTGDVNVPSNSVGSSAKIYAIGLDADMNMTDQDEVNLVLDTNVVLEDIFFGFGYEWIFDFKTFPQQSHEFRLYPMGVFSDGSEHPLSVLSEPTTYETYDANIATVDANGLITVHSRGTTWIMVTCSERTSYLQIEVDALIGDLNLNGMVDFSDFAILAGQWLQPPVIPSADIAPESRDGVVDLLDLAVFVEHWLEGDLCPDDPNKIHPGACGCGIPDVDVNGDGSPDCGFRYGDVSGEGEVTAYDAALAAQCSEGLIELSDLQLFAADVDGDSCISAADADLIAQYVVGLITVFPVEQINPKPTTVPSCGCP